MKIEKINENQFRCILSREDLQDRHLHLSELAYGSQKARDFFQDIVLEANKETGFEAEDEPLMIEAIPISEESLILLVTKVENPEELDPRFSNFTPDGEHTGEEPETDTDSSANPFAESVLDVFTQLGNSILGKLLGKDALSALTDKKQNVVEGTGTEKTEKKASKRSARKAEENRERESVTVAKEKAFCFPNLERAAAFAKTVRNSFHGNAVLYRHPTDRSYTLVLLSEGADVQEYNIACNIACEYGTMLDRARTGVYEEYYRKVFSEHTIETLAEL